MTIISLESGVDRFSWGAGFLCLVGCDEAVAPRSGCEIDDRFG